MTNNRTDYVLRCMYENQFITREEYEAAKNPATAGVLQAEPGSDSKGIFDYPHYIEYAVKETVQILLEVNGLPDTAANRAAMENKLRTGGYKIQLAIDPEIQKTVEETLQNWTKYPSLRDPSDKVFRSRNSDGTCRTGPSIRRSGILPTRFSAAGTLTAPIRKLLSLRRPAWCWITAWVN